MPVVYGCILKYWMIDSRTGSNNYVRTGDHPWSFPFVLRGGEGADISAMMLETLLGYCSSISSSSADPNRLVFLQLNNLTAFYQDFIGASFDDSVWRPATTPISTPAPSSAASQQQHTEGMQNLPGVFRRLIRSMVSIPVPRCYPCRRDDGVRTEGPSRVCWTLLEPRFFGRLRRQ